MNFKYLLFDLDGTLTDPFEGITKCVQYALSSCGVEIEDLNELKAFIGPPLVPAFMEYYGFSKEKAEYALKKYRERFSDVGIFENKLFDGIPKLLSDLNNAGFKLCLATSKPEVYAVKILEHFDISKYFDFICGATLDESRSEKWEVIYEIIKQLKLENKKSEMLMIGDRKHDIIGAKKCGIKSLGIYTGYAEEGELEKAGADFICNYLDELRKFLLN